MRVPPRSSDLQDCNLALRRIFELRNSSGADEDNYWRQIETLLQRRAENRSHEAPSGLDVDKALDHIWSWAQDDGDLGREYWTRIASLLR